MAISSFMPPPADGSEPRSKAKPAVPPAEPALRWDEGLRLGVEEIDAQHQALLGHCNELVEAIRQGHGAEALGKTMAKLRDYTATHFAAEERYMERIGYPELPPTARRTRAWCAGSRSSSAASTSTRPRLRPRSAAFSRTGSSPTSWART